MRVAPLCHCSQMQSSAPMAPMPLPALTGFTSSHSQTMNSGPEGALHHRWGQQQSRVRRFWITDLFGGGGWIDSPRDLLRHLPDIRRTTAGAISQVPANEEFSKGRAPHL